jgi:hypothetical protein
MTALDGWENFYVIVGSSGGALIGLQFVVLTLVGDMPITGATPQAVNAFTTPSVVHFGMVLFLSAVISAPWEGLEVVGIIWGLAGLGGIIYSLVVTRRMRAQSVYEPVLEDWLFHSVLPLVAYASLAVAAGLVHACQRPALFLVAGAALLLLFIGIHNAWDIVAYHVFVQKQKQQEAGQGNQPEEKQKS